MVKSRCCKAQVDVYCANEGTCFYICCHCGRACDTISERDHYGWALDDAGGEAEVEGTVGAA